LRPAKLAQAQKGANANGNRKKVEASVARRLRAPPASATLQGFDPSYDAALRSGAHRSIVVIGNYRFDPITAVSCRAKEHLLHPRRSCFAPAATRPCCSALRCGGLWWRRRVPPPGPDGLLRCPFITIVPGGTR